MPNGAELFVESISQLGIREIFTLVGDHLNEVLAVAARAGIRIIDMRHESGVTHTADAWARIRRKPSLSLVTGGPGHTNSLTGIATANLAASPLIAVSGSRATTLADRQAFQDIDQVGTARPIAKWAAAAAQRRADSVLPGPRLCGSQFGPQGRGPPDDPGGSVHRQDRCSERRCRCRWKRRRPMPGSREIERAMALLKAAERPVVIAGSGVWWSGAEQELQAFHRAHVAAALHHHDGARRGLGRASAQHGLCGSGAEQGRPHGVSGGRSVPGGRQAARLSPGAGRRAPVSRRPRNSSRSIFTRRNWG